MTDYKLYDSEDRYKRKIEKRKKAGGMDGEAGIKIIEDGWRKMHTGGWGRYVNRELDP